MAKPLVQLTQKDTPFIFNNNCIKAFKELKNWLISFLIFYHYNLDLELILKINTSNKVIVGILLQLYLDGEWYPITFFLKIMAPAECNYKVYNKEMLAII